MWKELLSLLAMFATQFGTVFLVLTGNLSEGVYPHDSDAIVIPLVETTVLALFALVLASVAISLPTRRGIFRGVRFLLLALASFLSFAIAVSYAIPHHYEITTIFGVCVSIYAWLAFRALTTSPALRTHPDQTPQSPA